MTSFLIFAMCCTAGISQEGAGHRRRPRWSSKPQPPINVNTLDLVDEIDDVLDRVAGLEVAALVRQAPMQFKLWAGGQWRMDYLDGVQRALEIARVWRKADEVIGIGRRWQQRRTKCPKCNTRTLGNFAGSDSVQCSSCEGVMTLDEYKRITLIQADKGELPDLWTAQTTDDQS